MASKVPYPPHVLTLLGSPDSRSLLKHWGWGVGVSGLGSFRLHTAFQPPSLGSLFLRSSHLVTPCVCICVTVSIKCFGGPEEGHGEQQPQSSHSTKAHSSGPGNSRAVIGRGPGSANHCPAQPPQALTLQAGSLVGQPTTDGRVDLNSNHSNSALKRQALGTTRPVCVALLSVSQEYSQQGALHQGGAVTK